MITNFKLEEKEISFKVENNDMKINVEDFISLLKEFGQCIQRQPELRHKFREYGLHPSGRFFM